MAEGKIGFGDFLVRLGILTADQLKRALPEQKQRGERLEQTLIRLKYASEEKIMQCLADYFSLPFIDLNNYLIDEKVIEIIPEEMARRHMLVPLFAIGNTITVAMSNPLNIFALDAVKNRTKTDVEVVISTEEKIQKAIDKHYGATVAGLGSTIQQLAKMEGSSPSAEPIEYRKSYNLAGKEARPGQLEEASATQMFDGIMIQAIRDRASDIHLEPEEKALRVRLRIDGLLQELLSLPKPLHPCSPPELRSWPRWILRRPVFPRMGASTSNSGTGVLISGSLPFPPFTGKMLSSAFWINPAR